ncbi:hypothetical protein BC831DRAFT_454810 [Entophlyctis helioformis]|nr:hypothetical protein BC831DRAFT_454810 [Entophlyctis helioformis]
MPFYQVCWQAEVVGLTDLVPANPLDYPWEFKFECTSCHEKHDSQVSVNARDQVEVPGGRGSANLNMRCKFCKRDGNVSLDMATLKPYPADKSGKMAPLLKLECRGWEPVEWIPLAPFQAVGVESNTKFKEIDLTDREWADYDEKAGESVSVLDVETKIERA